MECHITPPSNTEDKMYSTQTHGFISLPLATFGIILNILVISIFLQKTMRNSTNNILIGISLSDFFMMLIYAINSIYFFILHPDPYPEQSRFWPYFQLAYHHISVYFHACSVWLTCYLALYRLINAAHCVLKRINNKLVMEQNVNFMMILIVSFVFVLMIPNMLIYDVKVTCLAFICTLNTTSTLGQVDQCSQAEYQSSKITSRSLNETIEHALKKEVAYFKIGQLSTSKLSDMYPHLVSLNLSIHSIMFRAVPCMILVVLSIMLIYVLGIANKNKRKLVDRQEDRQQTDFNRTTTMLLLIVILFIIMEFPNGLLLLIGSFSQQAYYDLSDYFADFLDLLVLTNCSVNFFMYCIMSSDFRRVFRETYLSGNILFCRSRSRLYLNNRLSSREKINLELRSSKKSCRKNGEAMSPQTTETNKDQINEANYLVDIPISETQ